MLSNRAAWLLALTTVLSFAVATGVDAGRQQSQAPGGSPQGASSASQAPDQGAGYTDIDDLRDNPKQYEGRTIRIKGEVEDVIGPRLIKVSQNTLFDLFDDDVFVYAPKALALAVRDDDQVTVSGRLQTFVGISIKEELGWFQPDPDVEAEFDRQYVILADTIEREGKSIAVATAGAGAPTGTGPEVTALDAFTGDGAKDLVGRAVNVSGVVEQTLGNRTFALKSGDQQILAVAAPSVQRNGSALRYVDAGASVQVQGFVLSTPDLDLPGDVPAHQRFEDADVYIYATNIAAAAR